MKEKIEPENIDIKMEFEFIRQQIIAMGNNDDESGALNIIWESYLKKEISDTEAIEWARQIRDGKQDH